MTLAMTTTLTVSSETHRKLKMLKKDREASSFDELLEDIAEEELDVPSTEEMFGSMEIKDREKIRDRNDRVDRYE